MVQENPAIRQVTVFGELFGGIYDHPDVAAVAGVIPVQLEIQYCPGLRFRAYDIAVEGEGLPRDYVDYDVVMRVLAQAGVDYSHPLLTVTMEEALHYDIERDTEIPRSFGLPALSRRNRMEGVVVKPIRTAWVDSPKGKRRVIVKIKNVEFLESQQQDLKKEPGNRAKRGQTGEEGPAALLKEELGQLNTRNRLINTISKVGSIQPSSSSSKGAGKKNGGGGGKGGTNTKHNRERVEEMLAKEIWEEGLETFGDVAAQCTPAQLEDLKRWLRSQVTATVDHHLAA